MRNIDNISAMKPLGIDSHFLCLNTASFWLITLWSTLRPLILFFLSVYYDWNYVFLIHNFFLSLAGCTNYSSRYTLRQEYCPPLPELNKYTFLSEEGIRLLLLINALSAQFPNSNIYLPPLSLF